MSCSVYLRSALVLLMVSFSCMMCIRDVDGCSVDGQQVDR